jgi:hypothetical protein
LCPNPAPADTIETEDIARATIAEAAAVAARFSYSKMPFSEITMVVHENFHAF